MSKRITHGTHIDERVQLQRLTFQSETLTIVSCLLFASVVIKSHIPHIPGEQLLPEVAILLICVIYPPLRSLLAGDVDAVSSGQKSVKASAVEIILYSASLAIFVGVLNYYQFKDKYQSILDWHFLIVPLVVFVGTGLCMTIVKIATSVLGRSAQRRIEKQLED